MRYCKRNHGVSDPTGELAIAPELLRLAEQQLGQLRAQSPRLLRDVVAIGNDAAWDAWDENQARIASLDELLQESWSKHAAQVAMPKPGRVAELMHAFGESG
jgi:hypothetical protein